MRTALITFAIAGMTLAAKKPVHHGEETVKKVHTPAVKPIVKGPTPVNKPHVHWGEQSYAQAAKKGAKLGMFKLPHFTGEDFQAFKARLGKRLAGLKERLHHFGESAATHGKRLGHKAKQGMRKLHHHGEESHVKKHAKLALFKLPHFSGEEFQAFKARLGKRLTGLKQRLHHFGESAAAHGKRLGHKAKQGMRKLHHHGEESHVKKHAKLALLKKATHAGEETSKTKKAVKATVKATKTAAKATAKAAKTAVKKTAEKTHLKKKTTHAGEESAHAKSHKKTAKTVLKKKTHSGEDSSKAVKKTSKPTVVNRGAWSFLKKSATVHGEEVAKRHGKKNGKKNGKKLGKVHGGESTHKGKNPLSKRNKRHARKHSGEEKVRKNKKAALGLYELSSLLNSIDA